METYRFVEALAVGRQVRLYYQTAGVHDGNEKQIHDLPYLVVTQERDRELQAAAPRGFKKSTFRLVLHGEEAEVEWT